MGENSSLEKMAQTEKLFKIARVFLLKFFFKFLATPLHGSKASSF